MYLVAYTFIFMHVCVCTYMCAQLDPIQLYKCIQVDLRGVTIFAGMKVNMSSPKLGGHHLTHIMWCIFMYVHEHTPVLLVKRMIVKTIGGYTYAFLSVKCTFSNDLYTKPNLHEVILI